MFVVGHNNSDVGQTIKYTHLKGRQIAALNKTFFKISNQNTVCMPRITHSILNVSLKQAGKYQLKSRPCFALLLPDMTDTNRLFECTIWSRKKSAISLHGNTIFRIFLLTASGAVVLSFTKSLMLTKNNLIWQPKYIDVCLFIHF